MLSGPLQQLSTELHRQPEEPSVWFSEWKHQLLLQHWF